MKLDLSLHNQGLYDGCEVEEVAGRLNLKTPMKEAVNIVGRNINRVVHRFSKVYYDDGRSGPVLAETQHIKQGVIIMTNWNDVFNMLWEYMRKLRAHDKSKVEIGVRMTSYNGALVCRVFGSMNHGPEHTQMIMYYPPQEEIPDAGDELVKRLLEEVGK